MPAGSKPGERRGGRVKGTPNRVTADIKTALLGALDSHEGGAVGYFEWLRVNNSAAFSGLIGKILPSQIEQSGPDGGPQVLRIEGGLPDMPMDEVHDSE